MQQTVIMTPTNAIMSRATTAAATTIRVLDLLSDDSIGSGDVLGLELIAVTESVSMSVLLSFRSSLSVVGLNSSGRLLVSANCVCMHVQGGSETKLVFFMNNQSQHALTSQHMHDCKLTSERCWAIGWLKYCTAGLLRV